MLGNLNPVARSLYTDMVEVIWERQDGTQQGVGDTHNDNLIRCNLCISIHTMYLI